MGPWGPARGGGAGKKKKEKEKWEKKKNGKKGIGKEKNITTLQEFLKGPLRRPSPILGGPRKALKTTVTGEYRPI